MPNTSLVRIDDQFASNLVLKITCNSGAVVTLNTNVLNEVWIQVSMV